VFENPDDFDIVARRTTMSRSGAGPTSASARARLELRVMLEELLDRLPDLAHADATEPTHRAANFVSGYESFRVVFPPTSPR
jgi:cholest-4-en-3-one 26-monooxygenase